MVLNFNILRRVVSFVAVALSIVICAGCKNKNSIDDSGVPARIISLAPSVTETMFALGLGDRLVGVTRYCLYPAEALEKAQVGGYTDPNYEAILSLHPDLVILLKEHEQVKDFLVANHIRFLAIDNHDITGIIASIDTLGVICGAAKAADSISSLIRNGMLRDNDTPQQHPKVLLGVGRESVGCGNVGEVWVAGKRSIYNEILEACGAENIIADTAFDYPTLTTEGIIRLQPDIIIEITNHIPGADLEKVKKDWEKLDMLPAVKNDMIFFLTRDYVTVPGPRTILLLGDVRDIVDKYRDRAED
jgi:iron complex transport system substrate-binding protein